MFLTQPAAISPTKMNPSLSPYFSSVAYTPFFLTSEITQTTISPSSGHSSLSADINSSHPELTQEFQPLQR